MTSIDVDDALERTIVHSEGNDIRSNDLERQVKGLKNDIDSLRAAIKKAEAEIEVFEAFIKEVLCTEEYSKEYLEASLSSNPAMFGRIQSDKTQEENARILRELVDRRTDDIKSFRGSLEENKADLKQLQQSEGQGSFRLTKRADVSSGLFYDQASHHIGTAPDGADIGVSSVDLRSTFRLSPDCYAKVLAEWRRIGANGSVGSTWCPNFSGMLPNLDPAFLRNAWRASQFEFDLGQSGSGGMGEMTFQQLVCPPFSILLMSAAGGCNTDNYYADENVSSSLSVQYKSKEALTYGEFKLCIQPDAAATLGKSWDAFGMLEIKKGQFVNDDFDEDRCTLLTATTAIIIRDCLKMKDRKHKDHIALPFVIVKGTTCSLYVTTLDSTSGYPYVQEVTYPDDGNACNQMCDSSPSDERQKMFAAFAVLLDKFLQFFHGIEKEYDSYAREKQTRLRNSKINTVSFSGRSSKRPQPEGPEGNNSKKQGGTKQQMDGSEDAAREAAACGGMFRNVTCPFMRLLQFNTSDVVMDEQKESPFYFKGLLTSSDVGATTQDVFLKVWKVEDIDISSVESEERYHRQAFMAGVPVGAPVLPSIVRSKDADGSEYLVFAVEYIHEDCIDDPRDLGQYCFALIDTVNKLHNQAGLLHCDLKPDNVRWSTGVVKLIDFEHAQTISEAAWSPGTQGYEAPEILKRMPNTMKTDAFSVGQIILKMLERLEDQGWAGGTRQEPICNVLRQIAENLTCPDPVSRWSLPKAAAELNASSMQQWKAVHTGTTLMTRKLSDSSSPPNKIVKSSHTVLIDYH
jgi:Protein kinase domain